MPWSPLAYGLLTGKYDREDTKKAGSRLSGANPFGDSLFTEQNWRTVDALREVAKELDLPMSRVALSWVRQKSGVGSTILGARTLEQLHDNLASLEVDLPTEIVTRLESATGFDPGFLAALSTPGSPMVRHAIYAGARVDGWR